MQTEEASRISPLRRKITSRMLTEALATREALVRQDASRDGAWRGGGRAVGRGNGARYLATVERRSSPPSIPINTLTPEAETVHIAELTWRNRNDFHFIAHCRHCQKKSRHGDGYADAMYQQRVFPARHCEHCGLNEYGERSEALAEPAS